MSGLYVGWLARYKFVMVDRQAHVLECLRRAVPDMVPADAAAVPQLWRHQMPWVTMGDVVWALAAEGSGESLRVLRDLLPGVSVVPRVRGGAVPPRVTTAKNAGFMPKIHVIARGNPHPPGTSLHRNWWRYREGLPVDVYRKLGGSPRCLEGDLRRGLIQLAS